VPNATSRPEPPPPPHPEAIIATSLFTPDGNYWGAQYDPKPEPASLIRPCYERALVTDPELGGWLSFSLRYYYREPVTLTLAESSKLPQALVDCITRALSSLRPPSEALDAYTALYISLRPKAAAESAP
jgi:hypothetical protein